MGKTTKHWYESFFNPDSIGGLLGNLAITGFQVILAYLVTKIIDALDNKSEKQ